MASGAGLTLEIRRGLYRHMRKLQEEQGWS